MSALIRPVTFIWTADGRMAPMPRFKRMCDQQFVVGEEYPLQILEARSRRAHNHFFASVHEAWKNLPEDVATDMPSPNILESLRFAKLAGRRKRISFAKPLTTRKTSPPLFAPLIPTQ